MDPLGIAGLGLGLIGGIGGLFGAKKSNRKLEELIKQNPQYQANPIAAQRMGLAQTLLNARMPGAAAAERNIEQGFANTMGNVNRNATDASQALATAAAMRGQANQQYGNLATAETLDYQRRLGNLNQAQEGQIQEGDKVYQDQVRRFQDLAQIRGAQAHNRQASWQSLGNLGFGMMGMGLAGGGSMFGGGGAGSRTPDISGMDHMMRGRALNMPLMPIS